VTRIDTIDGAARIDELARMLGGGALTDTSRAHAAELYTRAQRG
jgi:DNA repair protein RecN (Recombination protein N)